MALSWVEMCSPGLERCPPEEDSLYRASSSTPWVLNIQVLDESWMLVFKYVMCSDLTPAAIGAVPTPTSLLLISPALWIRFCLPWLLPCYSYISVNGQREVWGSAVPIPHHLKYSALVPSCQMPKFMPSLTPTKPLGNSHMCFVYLKEKASHLKDIYSLTAVAQLVGCHPAKWKGIGSIPSQGTCLGWGFGPQSGQVWEATDPCFSLI